MGYGWTDLRLGCWVGSTTVWTIGLLLPFPSNNFPFSPSGFTVGYRLNRAAECASMRTLEFLVSTFQHDRAWVDLTFCRWQDTNVRTLHDIDSSPSWWSIIRRMMSILPAAKYKASTSDSILSVLVNTPPRRTSPPNRIFHDDLLKPRTVHRACGCRRRSLTSCYTTSRPSLIDVLIST
jgi:hypothetical protein